MLLALTLADSLAYSPNAPTDVELPALSLPMRATAQARATLRWRVRAVGGALLLVSACVAALVALSARSAHVTPSYSHTRQLTEIVHLSKTHATTTPTAASNDSYTEADAIAEAAESACGPLAPWETQGGIFVYVFLLLYVFVALAIVCDDYFVSSLEKITDALGLSQDVAGATFMAAGSSAPELFVSLADNVFAKPQQSLGIGTIVGSAIFNILIIIALSALLAGQVLKLDWRPLLRDSLWYCWSIVVLTYTIWDGKVDVYESVALFGSYLAYILYMSQNEKILNACCKRPVDADSARLEQMREQALDDAAEYAARLVDGYVDSQDAGKRAWTIDVERVERTDDDSGADGSERQSDGLRMTRQGSTGSQLRPSHPHRLGSQSKLNPMYRSKYRMFQYHPQLQERSASGRMLDEGSGSATEHKANTKTLRDLNIASVEVSQSTAVGKKTMEVEVEEQEQLGGYFDEIFHVPAGFFPKLWFVFTRPIVIPMRLTIPDCRYPMFSGPIGYTSTFVLAIAWIALLSNLTVVWATKFGCLAGIPSALMGLTIIAAGTSVPDALSSVLVARDGQGDMAVSNAIGSNVFDILLGLGLPFFLSNLIYKEPVVVVTDDLELSIFILFGVLVAVILLLLISRWRLHPVTGGIMAMLYAAYVAFSYLRGLGQI